MILVDDVMPLGIVLSLVEFEAYDIRGKMLVD